MRGVRYMKTSSPLERILLRMPLGSSDRILQHNNSYFLCHAVLMTPELQNPRGISFQIHVYTFVDSMVDT